jgi:3-oxoacyl-[acyl-carrier protein] reductase
LRAVPEAVRGETEARIGEQHRADVGGHMLTSIAGRSVIVTGASKGIGKGIAKVFCRNGGKVVVVSRHLAEAEACAQELRRDGSTATGCAADVTSSGDIEMLAEHAVAAHGGIDILCVNAGIYPQARIEDLSPEDWDHVVATNLKGTFLVIKACLPHLKKSDQGRIVLTSSITGPITGFPGWSHYGATKAGQLGFMRTASLEVAKHGITVNAILPGNISTEGLTALGPDYERSMAAAIPLKRLGTVEDIGYAALFLASKEAAYITGQTIVVDGGQILPESLDALA